MPPAESGREPIKRYDRVNEVRVHSVEGRPSVLERSGSTDVLLVHGLAVSNRYLVPSVRRLAVDRRVLAPDLPGVGRSSAPARRRDMSTLADGLRDWMDVVGIDRAVVIGHSLGCQLAALLAVRHPTRVAAVVLASPGPDPAQQSLWRQALALLVDGFRERPSMVLIAAVDYLRVGMVSMLRMIRTARRSDTAEAVRRIRQPALVVYGDRDPLLSARWAEVLSQALPSGSLAALPDAPHGIPYSSVESFTTAIQEFLDTVEDGAVGP